MSNLPPLRLWQESAYKNWISNNLRGIVEVATAGGKTRFALECLLHYRTLVKDECIVIITPTTALADQWNFALTEDMGILESDICIWPETSDLGKKIHILVINTARTKLPKIIELHPEAFVIADEIHRYGSEENSKAFKSEFKYSLGLTATAEREFDEGLTEVLIPAFGKIIYEYSLIDASKDEIISPFALINVEVPLLDDEQNDYDNLSKSIARALGQGNSEKAMLLSMRRANVAKNSSMRVPSALQIARLEKDQKILIFHESINKAEEIHSQLKSEGFSVGIYHSQIHGPLRRETLYRYKRGMIRILISCRALDEGVDIPDANVAIIAAYTSSLRQRVQRLGRVLRKHPTKEYATIYTLYSTDKERSQLVSEMERLDGVANIAWKKVTV
jgi:superfamily II DNA or RNA helicase